MRNFFRLFRVQFLAALHATFNRNFSKSKKKTSGNPIGGGMIVLYAFLLIVAGVYEWLFGSAFVMLTGNIDTFLTLLVFSSSALTLLSSITNVKNLVFCSKDYDMAFSLPVPAGTVVAAKIATVYAFDLISTLMILLPWYAVSFFLGVELPTAYVALFPLFALFVPMIPMMLGAILSSIVSYIAAHFKYMRVVSTLFYVALIGGIFFLSFSAGMTAGEEEDVAALLANANFGFLRYYPFARWFTETMNGSVSSACLFLGVSIACAALVCFVFGKLYNVLHDFYTKKPTGAKYRRTKEKNSAFGALVKKELSRVFGTSILLVNSGSGCLMLVIFGVLILAKIGDIPAEDFAEVAAILTPAVPFFLGMFGGMSSLSAYTISLEGKCMGLLKSFPVSAKTILRAKMTAHMVFCTPLTAVGCLLFAVALKMDVLSAILTVLIPIAGLYIFGVIGLLVNLKKYNLEWTNEAVIAKQGAPVFVVVFGSMLTGMVFIAVAIIVSLVFEIGTPILFGAFFVIELIAALLFRRKLYKVGPVRFARI